MASNENNEAHNLLDAYVDGRLDDRARAEFERAMAADDGLRSLVELQTSIDASIRRSHPIPNAKRVVQGLNGRLKSSPTATATPPSKTTIFANRKLVARLSMAAALFLAVGGTWYFTRPPAAEPVPWITQQWSLPVAYEEMVKTGFKPLWLCKNDHQFAATFKKRFDQGLIMAKSADVTCLGISYINSITPKTTCLLLDDRGSKSMVFVDSLAKDRDMCMTGANGLNLFRREIGKTVLYELTPQDAPHALDLITTIDVPPEWLKEYADGSVPGASSPDRP